MGETSLVTFVEATMRKTTRLECPADLKDHAVRGNLALAFVLALGISAAVWIAAAAAIGLL